MTHLYGTNSSIPGLNTYHECWTCKQPTNDPFAKVYTLGGTELHLCQLKCYQIFHKEMKRRDEVSTSKEIEESKN